MGNGVVPDGIVNFLSGSPKVDELKDKVAAVESNIHKHEQSISIVETLLQFKLHDTLRIHWNLSLKEQAASLTRLLNNIDRLFQLIRFNQLAGEMTKNGLDFVVSAARTWNFGEESLVKMFNYSRYNGLVEKAYLENPCIKSFDRIQHAHV